MTFIHAVYARSTCVFLTFAYKCQSLESATCIISCIIPFFSSFLFFKPTRHFTMTDHDAALAAELQAQFDHENVGFAVEPITTCPHVPAPIPTHVFLDQACGTCEEPHENWQCLTCNTVLCSRYRNGHMLKHFEQTKDHAVCLSYSDLSIWCFQCENYIANEVSIILFSSPKSTRVLK